MITNVQKRFFNPLVFLSDTLPLFNFLQLFASIIIDLKAPEIREAIGLT